MSVIVVFSASYCRGDELLNKIAEKTGYEILTAEKLLEHTSLRYGSAPEKLKRAMHSSPSVFNKFTHEKERNVAYIKAAMAELIGKDNIVFHGFATHLLPKTLTHVLRVCLVAGSDYRVAQAVKTEEISEKDAERIIRKDDNERLQWTQYLFELGPWDRSLYDIIIPMHTSSVDEALGITMENINKPALKTTPAALKAVEDFQLATKVNVVLAKKGYDVDVTGKNGSVTIIINKYVLRLDQFEKKLEKIAGAVPEVEGVKITVGPKFHQPNIYMSIDLEIPPKILLVDDEREFVHTLSERLQTRNIESAVAYDGEEALSIMEADEPEVMVLDLKMPGIDGIEVLRRTKLNHPGTEVIILTGHGTEKEEALARELGAFAYLHKPVDIEVLTKTMKEAYRKVSETKAAKTRQPEGKNK